MYKPITIRLWRRGRRLYPVYQIVVIFISTRSRGKLIQSLGYFNPHFTERVICIDGYSLAKWLNKGAIMHKNVVKHLNWLNQVYIKK